MSVVLTVDVEDWAQSTLDPSLPIYPRAQRNTEYLLDLVAEYDRKLTCFVLGKFAEKFPGTIRRMVDEGHEVASHGYGHVEVFKQSASEFREDIRRSKKQLEDMTGRPVEGYRAPCFSLGSAGNWPFEVLVEEGFSYDSSIFPTGKYRYGRSNWPAHPTRVNLPSGHQINEVPAATLKLGKRMMPIAGGGYHRLLPWRVIRWCVKSVLDESGTFIMYCHPYEFDPAEFSNLPIELPWKVRLHQGLGRRGFEKKFRNLLSSFPTSTLSEMLREEVWPEIQLPEATLHRAGN